MVKHSLRFLAAALLFLGGPLAALEAQPPRSTSPAPPSAFPPWLGYVCVGLVVLLVLWVLIGVVRAMSGAGTRISGNSSYGGGGGSSGFFPSLLGGMFGAGAGMWMYNQFFGGHSPSAGAGSPFPASPLARPSDPRSEYRAKGEDDYDKPAVQTPHEFGDKDKVAAAKEPPEKTEEDYKEPFFKEPQEKTGGDDEPARGGDDSRDSAADDASVGSREEDGGVAHGGNDRGDDDGSAQAGGDNSSAQASADERPHAGGDDDRGDAGESL